MSTATRRWKRRPSELLSGEPANQPPKPRRRWIWPTAMVAGFAVLLWLLPAIVAHSGLPQSVLRRAASDLDGSVALGSIELGWLSAPRLSTIEIRDPQGQPVIQVEAITLGRSLAALVWDHSNLGHVRIERPRAHVVLGPGPSNLETLFAKYLDSDTAAPLDVRFDLEVTDAACSITDGRTGTSWRIEPLALSVQMPDGPQGAIKIDVQGQLAGDTGPGKLDLALECNPAAAGKPQAWLKSLTAGLEDVPLAMLAPLLGRAVEGTRLSGRADATLRCASQLEDGRPEIAFAGDVSLTSLDFSAMALNGDTIQLATAHATCQGNWSPDRIVIDQVAVQTEPARATLQGPLALAGGSPRQRLDALAAQPCRLEADADLAQLAAMLPATLHLRQSTRITSGKAQLELSSRAEAGTAGAEGHLEVTGLAAEREGHTIDWPQPLRAVFSVHRAAGTLVVDKAHFASDFFQVDASGTTRQGTAGVQFDLDRLAQQMGELFDLDRLALAGQGDGKLDWNLDETQKFSTRADFHLHDFRLAWDEQPPWTEPQVDALLEAAGQIEPSGAVRLDQARLETTAGDDRLEARLAQPLADLAHDRSWPVHIESSGDLARWQTRLGGWIDSTGWQFQGNLQLVAQADLSPAAIRLRHAKLNTAKLAIQGPSLNLHEPSCELVLSQAAWLPAQDRLELDWATYSGHGLGARLEALRWNPHKHPYALAGRIAAQGGVDRLQQWATATLTAPPKWRLAGQWNAAAELLPENEKTTVRFDARAENLTAVHASGQTIQEPVVRLAGRGTFDTQQRILQLQTAKLQSGILGADLQGQLDFSGDVPQAQLGGQVDYDLVRLSELFRLSTGLPLFVAGHNTGPLSYRGWLRGDAAEGAASIRWDGADLFGFLIGPGTLDAQLSQGVLHARPIQVEVNHGRMELTPEVRFAGQSGELLLAPGKLAQEVQITPRMCAGALQYIAPVLAGVASAEGTFSIELDACRIPLANPAAGDLSGRFIIHSVQVAPGPLVRQLALALGYRRPAELARQSVVSFRMVQGRVYHRDLQLVFPDLTVRTYGSVGLDQSLALIAEMPVPPKWRTPNETVNLALKDQVIRLPVGGTLAKPVLDQRELERFSRQFMQKAVENVIGNELNRQFDRLFQPQPPPSR